METIITILAWIGLIVVTIFFVFTLFIWLEWIVEQATISISRILGVAYCIPFLCAISLPIKLHIEPYWAAIQLYYRYLKMKKEHPKIAEEFEKLFVKKENECLHQQ